MRNRFGLSCPSTARQAGVSQARQPLKLPGQPGSCIGGCHGTQPGVDTRFTNFQTLCNMPCQKTSRPKFGQSQVTQNCNSSAGTANHRCFLDIVAATEQCQHKKSSGTVPGAGLLGQCESQGFFWVASPGCPEAGLILWL